MTRKNSEGMSCASVLLDNAKVPMGKVNLPASAMEFRSTGRQQCVPPPAHIEWEMLAMIYRSDGQEQPQQRKAPHDQRQQDSQIVCQVASERMNSLGLWEHLHCNTAKFHDGKATHVQRTKGNEAGNDNLPWRKVVDCQSLPVHDEDEESGRNTNTPKDVADDDGNEGLLVVWENAGDQSCSCRCDHCADDGEYLQSGDG